jgi:DNA repair exonuclease SbcCD ATPase subunit
MKIKRVEFRNFASYGNKIQQIEFEDGTGNFYLVLGQNGAGKSTISDVIKFALYGKLHNKKLKDIPNRFNKSAWCRITLDKDNKTEVIIERGVAPGYLKCFVNGIEYDQAGKKNVQNFIEEEVIGLPFYVFNNIISLSINDFKSFLSMRAHDKRMIIDKIFSLEIINRIRSYIKSESREIKDNILILGKEAEVLEHSIDKSQQELEKLEQQLVASNKGKVKEIKSKIHDYNEFLKKAIVKSDEITKKESSLHSKIADLNILVGNERMVVAQIKEKEKLYENDMCPTCGGDLTSDDHKTLHNELLAKKSAAEENLSGHDVSLEKFQVTQNKIAQAKSKIQEQRNKAVASVSIFQDELAKIIEEPKSNQTASLKNIIADSSSKKKTAKTKKANQEKKESFYKVLENVFGDRGVKQLAIKRILPSLNAEINRVIKDLNMEYRVMFNEEFDAVINHLGHRVSAQMLSTGERKKIDFAVLVALIRLMKLKFQGLNLIFLDEIFSSIDSDGIYHILQILSATCKELNLNIFVINHSVLPAEIFDYKLEITKNNGFSSIEIEKIQ